MSGIAAGVTQTPTTGYNMWPISSHFESSFLLETSKTLAVFDWPGENHVTPASPILISTELRNYSKSLLRSQPVQHELLMPRRTLTCGLCLVERIQGNAVMTLEILQISLNTLELA